MSEKGYTLGLNQRIPFAVIKEALTEELCGGIDENRLRELCQGEFTGDNRAAKTVNAVKSTIRQSALNDFIAAHKEDILQALKSPSDAAVIIMAIMCARYGFCYDVVCAFGKMFRLQDEVNTEVINRIVGVKYGMNKNVNNTLYRAVPMLVEAGMLCRPHPGLYTAVAPMETRYGVSMEAWKECYFINNPLYDRRDTESLNFEPFFSFVKMG